MAKSSDKPPRFEEAVEELETIIEQIESGQAGLEECITQYERGMKLITRCRAILDKAQQRIAELTTSAAGKLEIKDVDGVVEEEAGDE